jgi:N-acetylglucosamine kinase-like BadF-type ATPase
MYILGVDGGGTKIEFMVTDFSGQEVLRFEYLETTNLKYTTAEKVIAILDRAFDQIQKQIKLNDIKFAYLGIAECGENCVGKGRDKIVDFLRTKFMAFELADDQYSVFRAKSSGKNGVLANAGTGSNINQFLNGTEQNYKSVGMGGRDLGHLILNEINYGGIKPDSEIYKTSKYFLKHDPIEFWRSFKPLEYMLNENIARLPKQLIVESAKNIDLQSELDMFAILVASRWSLKLISYCNLNFNLQPTDKFELILTGSLWRWDKMRDMTTSDFVKNFPRVNIVYQPEKQPVVGAVIIALENIGIELVK